MEELRAQVVGKWLCVPRVRMGREAPSAWFLNTPVIVNEELALRGTCIPDA